MESIGILDISPELAAGASVLGLLAHGSPEVIDEVVLLPAVPEASIVIGDLSSTDSLMAADASPTAADEEDDEDDDEEDEDEDDEDDDDDEVDDDEDDEVDED